MKTVLFWLPRLIAISIAIFLSVFAFDVFSMPAPFGKKMIGFTIHTIPSISILIIAIITWKKSFWGSFLFTLLFIAITFYFKTYNNATSFLILSIPLLFIALLYTLEYFYIKRK
ncbi:MAG: hypothetical protein HOO91_19580 [Bacteroidales bacterium]|nr:hypothetical protein [Bacteroidales bacterium]